MHYKLRGKVCLEYWPDFHYASAHWTHYLILLASEEAPGFLVTLTVSRVVHHPEC